MARQLEENIYYMWLSGEATPNFRTINKFRGQKLKGKIQEFFAELVKLMVDLGYVNLDTQYVDGTKIEAASNKNTFVWRKSAEKNKEKLEAKVDSILKDISASIEEDSTAEDDHFKTFNSEELQEKIDELNKRLDTLNK